MNDKNEWPSTTDWCVGGCSEWKSSEEGIERFLDLKQRYESAQAEKQ